MNTNSISPRRPAGPVRQHSLHQPVIRRPQQQIRRQRSTDDEKSQQQSRVRFTNSMSTKGDQYNHNLPKVRVAWKDSLVKSKNENSVEIVARQIPTLKTTNRQTSTGRGGRGTMGRSSLSEKATILYSRQELAERLRQAWRQREENKSNIDIFLAHSTVEVRSDSSLSASASPTALPLSNLEKDEDSKESRIQVKQAVTTIEDNGQVDESRKPQECHFQPTNNSTDPPTIKSHIVAINDRSKDEYEEAPEEERIEVPCQKKSYISINCNNWNAYVTINNGTSDETDSSIPILTKEPDTSRARFKRASFQSGVNKAFNTPVVDKSPTPRISSRASSINSSSSQESTRFRRTNSAPPQHQVQSNEDQLSADNEVAVTSATEQPRSVAKSASRPIKSAPSVKRRSKPSRRRALSVKGNKDDLANDGTGKAIGKGAEEAKSVDVVTMVSLVSSADSESEIDENSARDDKLICELRNKLPTTPIIKYSNGLSHGLRKFKSVSFQQDSLDSEESPTQAMNSVENDSRASLRARFAALSKLSAGSAEETPLLAAATLTLSSWRSLEPSPSLRHTQSPIKFAETSPPSETIVLTDREKRCLAVPIGDIHDKKRKLVRCRSAVVEAPKIGDTKKHSFPSDPSQTCLSQIDSRQPSAAMQENLPPKTATSTAMNSLMAPLESPSEKDKDLNQEPYGQTQKEKECWHLYKKMCDKGVFVSFDTVLRGMLTPTEYRLRQKGISQSC